MKRGRGRGARKPSNNLNRTMESNGPDVKVRGTAHQICDKYQALARDAHASGDRIAYENYLQHAEHYHRIILASQQVAQEAAPSSREAEGEDASPVEQTAAAAPADAAPADDGTSEEAPRRARRGRRSRSDRSNGKSDGAGDGEEESATAKAKPSSRKASSGDAEAPVETA